MFSLLNLTDGRSSAFGFVLHTQNPGKVALHRRGSRRYIVFPRAYGMLPDWRLWAPSNRPQAADAHPPKSRSLNPMFWLHEQPLMPASLDDMLAADPPILQYKGIKRTGWSPNSKEYWEEGLVEMLLKEENLCQRCIYCGRAGKSLAKAKLDISEWTTSLACI